MTIEWIGHSCFYITLQSGKTIVIDVFGDEIGLPVLERPADIVLLTHDHFDHKNQTYLKSLPKTTVVVEKKGALVQDGIKITGIPIWHDEREGADRGAVVAYLIEAEGMRLLHLGDVGIMPSPEALEAFGKVDILMIPVGGVYTVDAKGALDIMDTIKPNITIPMHYLVDGLKLDIAANHDFLARAQNREYDISRMGCTFEITADNLKKRNRIVVMGC